MPLDSGGEISESIDAVSVRRRTIALVVPSLARGGGVPAVARFVKDALLRSGRYDLKLVSLSTSATDPDSVRLAAPSSLLREVGVRTGTWEGLPFVHVGAVAGEFEFQRYRPRKVLTRLLADCDLIQVVCGSPAWANAVLGLGKPVALQVATRARIERRQRDAHPLGVSGLWRKAMTEITDRMDNRALRRVDAIQVENPWMLEYARKLNTGRDVDLRYAPPGVDAETFRPLPARDLARSPYILCVGRLNDPRKNVGLLLEAYARLPKALRSEVRLVLAGLDGPPQAFWRRAEILGLRNQISFVCRPDRSALAKLYQDASVFALTSDEEGLGMVLLEAMASGIPVVSTRSGGPDGLIRHGEDGYLVPLDNAGELAARLAQVLQDRELNLQLGRKARQSVDRRYEERIAGAVFIDVWDRMVQRGEK